MKQFFEQYGGVALGILALLVLIAMITPVGNIIKTSLQSTVQTFGTKINDQTDTMTDDMNAAFTNAINFTGMKDGKYYANGTVYDFFNQITVDSNGNTTDDTTGKPITFMFDLNIIDQFGNIYYSGIDGLEIDFYINGTKVRENAIDANAGILLLGNPEASSVIKTKPENIEIVSNNAKNLGDLIVEEMERFGYIRKYEYSTYFYVYITYPIYVNIN